MVTDSLDSSKEQQKGENMNDGREESHGLADNESQVNQGQQVGDISGGYYSYHDTSDRRIYMSYTGFHHHASIGQFLWYHT
jgi:hypothetical protein